MPRVLSMLSLALVAALALTACGSEDSGTGTGGASTGGTPTIDITVKDGSVTPDGTEVKVERGKPITLRITADVAGELHVHSEPEQEIPYAVGTTEKTLTIEQPGVVDVEDHHLDTLVVQLQVR